MVWERVRSKKLFLQKIDVKIFDTNSSSHVKRRTTGKVKFLFFSRFLIVLTRFPFREGDQTLGNNSMKFWDFPDISWFPKILILKSFFKSWGNMYIPCLLLIIMLRFICGERKVCSTVKKSQIIMNKIVCKIYFPFLWLYQQL